MEPSLTFTAMNALLAIVMAALAFQMQRDMPNQARATTIAMLPLLCWVLWSAGNVKQRPAQLAGMGTLTEMTFTGALTGR